MIYLDTNYLLRYLLNDIPDQRDVVVKLLKQSTLESIPVQSSSVAFFETAWVLKSFYQTSKEKIHTQLSQILKLKTISFSEKTILNKSLELFKLYNLDLEDCYHLAYSLEYQADQLATFDQELEKTFAKLNQKG